MNTPQPGWYQDPTGLDLLRFFDGNEWTELTHPVPADGQETPQMRALGQQHMAQLGQGAAQAEQSAQGSQDQPAESAAGDGATPGPDAQGKTPGMVWGIMGVAIVGIAAIAIYANSAAGDKLNRAGQESKADGIRVSAENYSSDYLAFDLPDGFECEELAQDVIRISGQQDPEGEVVVSLVDVKLKKDSRDTFAIPASADDPESLAFSCSGRATLDTGETTRMNYEITVDYFEDLWVGYQAF